MSKCICHDSERVYVTFLCGWKRRVRVKRLASRRGHVNIKRYRMIVVTANTFLSKYATTLSTKLMMSLYIFRLIKKLIICHGNRSIPETTVFQQPFCV